MAIHKAASSAWDESRIEARPNSHVYWRSCKHTHPNTHTHTHTYVNKGRDKDIEVLYSVGVRVYSRYTYLKLHTASVKLESARARADRVERALEKQSVRIDLSRPRTWNSLSGSPAAAAATIIQFILIHSIGIGLLMLLYTYTCNIKLCILNTMPTLLYILIYFSLHSNSLYFILYYFLFLLYYLYFIIDCCKGGRVHRKFWCKLKNSTD